MKKKGAAVFLALAALILLFPTLGRLLPQPDASGKMNENRALAEWPEKAAFSRTYFQKIESWLNDHLAFRDQLIETNLRMDLALGESPTSTVLLGKNNWLYFIEFDEDRDFRGEIVLDEEDQEALISSQTSLQAYLADRGIGYYAMIAPNKQTIYPEYLPLSLQSSGKPTRLDQICRVLTERTEVPFIDVRPALLAAKGGKDLYYHYDHHWNETGTYYVFLAMAERIRQDYPTLYVPSPEEFYTTPGIFRGDLAAMIGMGDAYVDDCEWYQFPNSHAGLVRELSSEDYNTYINPDHPEAPKIAFVHDSFGPAVITFLKESCSVLYETTLEFIDLNTLLELEPDIVIFEKVERYSMALAEPL